ncbi:MAG: glycosyltransferase family 1 protein [Patescibacteria group bacterium]|jgi:glycosyltransferase involved in cell wall biosynthesis
MKIGIDGRFLHRSESGHGTYSEELIKNLAQIDNENEYVVFTNPSYESPLKQDNFSFVKTDIKHYSLKEQTSLHKILNSYNLDLMHFVHFNKPIFYKKKSIATIHDLTLSYFRTNPFIKQKIYDYMIKKTIKSVDHIITDAEFTKDKITEVYNIDPDIISVIYLGYSDRFRPISNKTLIKSVTSGYNITKPYIVYLGQQRPHKNLARLVRAFSLFRKKGLDYQLVFIGKKNPNYLEMNKEIEATDLKNNIIFTGFVPEDKIPVLISGSKLLVMPSLMEGFGLPVVEGFACHVPVASANTSSLPEVGGKAAAYFDPENVKEMAEVITSAVTDKYIRNKLIDNIDVQLKKFSWHKMAKEIQQVYKKVIQES